MSTRIHQINCSLTDVAKEHSFNLQENNTPNKIGTHIKVCKPTHVSTIQEKTCDELQWLIARLAKTSS
jgi:hypothetical protein